MNFNEMNEISMFDGYFVLPCVLLFQQMSKCTIKYLLNIFDDEPKFDVIANFEINVIPNPKRSNHFDLDPNDIRNEDPTANIWLLHESV